MPTEAAVKAEETLIHVLWINAAGGRTAFEVDQRPMHGDLGKPGERPSAISSIVGWVAAVGATESPSHPRPGGADDFLEWFFKPDPG